MTDAPSQAASVDAAVAVGPSGKVEDGGAAKEGTKKSTAVSIEDIAEAGKKTIVEGASGTAGTIEAILPGKHVEVNGTAMHGSIGEAVEFLVDKERWKVKFASGVTKNFKGENLLVTQPRKEKKSKKTKKRDRSRSPRKETGDAEQVEDESKEVEEKKEEVASMWTDASAQAESGTAKTAVSVGGASMSEVMERLKRESTKQTGPPQKLDASVAAEFAGAASELSAPREYNIAGRKFTSAASLREHVKKIQVDLEEGEMLEGEDRFFFFHLLMQHPKSMEKMRSAIKGFRYGEHPSWPGRKCFLVVFADGGEDEPVSIARCVQEALSSRKHLAEAAVVAERPAKRQRVVGPDEPIGERSRKLTGLKLIGEDAKAAGSMLADKWEYPLMDEEYRCFAGYLRCPFTTDVLKGYYKSVHEGTKWDRPVDPRSGEPLPRKTAWMVSGGCRCVYRYGGVDVSPQEFPPWMIEIMKAYMPLCGIAEQSHWPNSCNLNLYEDGNMSVGWHADDEKLFQGMYSDIRIISVSFGQTRTFELRTMGTEDDGERAKSRMNLRDGDICTMEGLTQKHYHHRVPKELAPGPRINITWRWVTKHKPDCSARSV